MTDIKTMFEYMDFCNGELRIMAGRYGGGWLACASDPQTAIDECIKALVLIVDKQARVTG